MVHCIACLQRCIRAVVAVQKPRGSLYHPPIAFRTIDHVSAFRHRRGYGTAATVEAALRPNDGVQPEENSESTRPPNEDKQTQDEAHDEATAADQGRKREKDLRREIRTELEYIRDPLKLGDRVISGLRDGEVDKMIDLVHEASKDMDCTVSWNHLVNYHMEEGKVKMALKIYNDMKKRGQTPDARTYTLLLRGLAAHTEYPSAMGKAIAIYESMQGPRSPVKPSVIHTNALLKVCSQAGDMDAMYNIAAKLPEDGRDAPDGWTWTTILNAIRADAETKVNSSDTPKDAGLQGRKAVVDGRRMWADIVGRWQQGGVKMEEQLVCAMGRLLMISDRPKDWDAVFSLVDQTMNIERMTARLEKPLHDAGEHDVGEDADAAPTAPRPGDEETEQEEPDESEDAFEIRLGESVLRSRRHGDPRSPTMWFAQPQNNTLSLLLEACLKLNEKKAATAYWERLTNGAVTPDAENYHAYLRVLRMARASAEAVKLLERMAEEAKEMPPWNRGRRPRDPVTPGRKSFWIAMSTCRRDKLNPHVFSNATRVLELMRAHLADLDVMTLATYLDVANDIDQLHARHAKDSKDASGSIEVKPKQHHNAGHTLHQALETLYPCILNIKSMIAYGRDKDGGQVDPKTKQAAISLVRSMAGAYGRLLERVGRAQDREWKLYRERTKTLEAMVERYTVVPKRRERRQQQSDGEDGDPGTEDRATGSEIAGHDGPWERPGSAKQWEGEGRKKRDVKSDFATPRRPRERPERGNEREEQGGRGAGKVEEKTNIEFATPRRRGGRPEKSPRWERRPAPERPMKREAATPRGNWERAAKDDDGWEDTKSLGETDAESETARPRWERPEKGNRREGRSGTGKEGRGEMNTETATPRRRWERPGRSTKWERDQEKGRGQDTQPERGTPRQRFERPRGSTTSDKQSPRGGSKREFRQGGRSRDPSQEGRNKEFSQGSRNRESSQGGRNRDFSQGARARARDRDRDSSPPRHRPEASGRSDAWSQLKRANQEESSRGKPAPPRRRNERARKSRRR